MEDQVNAFLSPFSELPEEKHDFVSCLTVDFAMQNVLLKMNLGRIGVDGRQINSVRKYVLRCTGCFYVDKEKVYEWFFFVYGITRRNRDNFILIIFFLIIWSNLRKTASKVFCPACGHKTMRRVACEVQHDGTVKLFLAKNPKCLNPRGKRFNLPAPKGGKYSHNPITTDMQPRPQQRISRKVKISKFLRQWIQKLGYDEDECKRGRFWRYGEPFLCAGCWFKKLSYGFRSSKSRKKKS